MTDKAKILLVDDAPEQIQILLQLLGQDFALTAATSGEKALAMLEKGPRPDLVLLDVCMPGLDGYQVCQKIHSDLDQSLPVIFLSANDSTEEIMRGFEVGACDYITKPVDEGVLKRKIESTLASVKTQASLQAQVQTANSIAMDAMSTSGDLGIVIDFLRQSFAIHDPAELTQALVDTLLRFDLQASVQLVFSQGSFNSGHNGYVSSLEAELLTRMSSQEETFFESGNRLFTHLRHITVVIKNYPHDAPDKAGRVKDYLMMLLEGANNKLTDLDKELNSASQRDSNMAQIILHSRNTLEALQASQQEHKAASVKIMDTMIEKIEGSFVAMGLTDEQEQEILTILSSSVEHTLDHFEDGLKMDDQVKEIIEALESVS